MLEAIQMHIEGLREDNLPIPNVVIIRRGGARSRMSSGSSPASNSLERTIRLRPLAAELMIR